MLPLNLAFYLEEPVGSGIYNVPQILLAHIRTIRGVQHSGRFKDVKIWVPLLDVDNRFVGRLRALIQCIMACKYESKIEPDKAFLHLELKLKSLSSADCVREGNVGDNCAVTALRSIIAISQWLLGSFDTLLL